MRTVASYRRYFALTTALAGIAGCAADVPGTSLAPTAPGEARVEVATLDARLMRSLAEVGFTGNVASTLTARLGRPLNADLAILGRLLFFDSELGLNNDNSCSGCHSPANGFGDSQSIAIGIQNNGIVGPGRSGPRNQRRSPLLTNIAFAPTLMWNSRFASASGDPFDNSRGFVFPPPEGGSLSYLPHLLNAQAFIPPTERVEMAGFAFPGTNDEIRGEVLRRLNAIAEYRVRFGRLFPWIGRGAPISFDEVGKAIGEFEFTLTFMNAPIDQYARGQVAAMTTQQKEGALLFFGRAGCVACHRTQGQSNELFSDFRQHVLAVPQIVPSTGNVPFDGPGANEDFGLAQVTGREQDRYAFRTTPLRNVALQRAFMHNGAYTRLEDAIRHHLDPYTAVTTYTPAAAGVAPDLQGPTGPAAPMLRRLDPKLRSPLTLSPEQFASLVEFVRGGLLDTAATRLRSLIPPRVPSGRPLHEFQ